MAPRKTLKKTAAGGNGSSAMAPAKPNPELIAALKELERDRNLSAEVLLEALEAALVSAYKRNFVREAEAVGNPVVHRRSRERRVPRVRAPHRRRRSRRSRHRDLRWPKPAAKQSATISTSKSRRRNSAASRHRRPSRSSCSASARPNATWSSTSTTTGSTSSSAVRSCATNSATCSSTSAKPRPSCRVSEQVRARVVPHQRARPRVRHGSAQDESRSADHPLAHPSERRAAPLRARDPGSRRRGIVEVKDVAREAGRPLEDLGVDERRGHRRGRRVSWARAAPA